MKTYLIVVLLLVAPTAAFARKKGDKYRLVNSESLRCQFEIPRDMTFHSATESRVLYSDTTDPDENRFISVCRRPLSEVRDTLARHSYTEGSLFDRYAAFYRENCTNELVSEDMTSLRRLTVAGMNARTFSHHHFMEINLYVCVILIEAPEYVYIIGVDCSPKYKTTFRPATQRIIRSFRLV